MKITIRMNNPNKLDLEDKTKMKKVSESELQGYMINETVVIMEEEPDTGCCSWYMVHWILLILCCVILVGQLFSMAIMYEPVRGVAAKIGNNIISVIKPYYKLVEIAVNPEKDNN